MNITLVSGFNPGLYTGSGNNTYLIAGEIPTLLDAATLEACFDLAPHMRHVDDIFERVFGA